MHKVPVEKQDEFGERVRGFEGGEDPESSRSTASKISVAGSSE